MLLAEMIPVPTIRLHAAQSGVLQLFFRHPLVRPPLGNILRATLQRLTLDEVAFAICFLSHVFFVSGQRYLKVTYGLVVALPPIFEMRQRQPASVRPCLLGDHHRASHTVPRLRAVEHNID